MHQEPVKFIFAG